MKIKGLVLGSVVLAALCAPVVWAQSDNSATNQPATIQQRKKNQQDRIAQGIRSGQLTPREAANLENKEQGVNRELKGMRQANGGKLSKADRQVVNQQQNKLSKQIYNKKHNGRTGY